MIRPATPADARDAARLIYDTIGNIAHTLTGTDDPNEAVAVIEDFFRQKGNRLSYENTLVKEVDHSVAGILISYHGSQTSVVDRPFVERLIRITGNPDIAIAKEAQDDEYYLDTIAVDPRWQGQGFGRELLAAFEDKARHAGHDKTALIVEKENDRAYSLYEKSSYFTDDILYISGYEMRHMTKHLTD
jgi:ribosomal protein S18 acetylase RimI-like enzyme